MIIPRKAYAKGSFHDTVFWQPVFSSDFPLFLPPIFGLEDDDLRAILWNCLSHVDDAFFHHWRTLGINIPLEFQKKNGGIFRPLIRGMRRTLSIWEDTLKDIRVLRLYEKPLNDGGIYQEIIIPPSCSLFPVHYRDDPSPTPEIMAQKMLGRHRVPVSYWYKDILLTMPSAFSEQKEWRSILS